MTHIVRKASLTLAMVALMTGGLAQAASAKTINWSGYTWTVKNGVGLGPGPNRWSDSNGSVWVDGSDSLNLKVRKISGNWNSAEVYLSESLGYGTYEFFAKSRVDIIDKNLVQAFFLYASDLEELDIEWSKWGDANNPYNGSFTVQPYYTSGNHYQFNQSIQQGDWHKHRIIWSASGVSYNVETDSQIVQSWTYTGSDNFEPGEERVHINNWQFQGMAPSNGQASTLTLASFTYTEL